MPKLLTPRSLNNKKFGRFVRRLRNARGKTQESLAERSGVSADTIRRLESGEFAPSLDTLSKVATGLRLDLGTLMMTFELNELGTGPELVAMARSLSHPEIVIALRILATLAELVGAIAGAETTDDA